MGERKRRKAAGDTKQVGSRVPSFPEGILDTTCFVPPAALRRLLSLIAGTVSSLAGPLPSGERAQTAASWATFASDVAAGATKLSFGCGR